MDSLARVTRGSSKSFLEFKTLFSLFRRQPSIVCVPLLLLGIVLGLSLWGIQEASIRDADEARNQAASVATKLSTTLQLAIEQALVPAYIQHDYLGARPGFFLEKDASVEAWSSRAATWWRAYGTNLTACLYVEGQGRVSAVWDPTGLYRIPVGTDSLSEEADRNSSLAAIAAQSPTMSGPMWSSNNSRYMAVVRFPIFHAPVLPDETWGMGYQPSACPSGLCYNTTTRSKWWGHAVIALDFAYYFSSPASPVAALDLGDYRWSVFRSPADGPIAAAAAAAEGRHQPREVVWAPKGAGNPRHDAPYAEFQIANQKWQVYVWKGSWEPSYRKPAIGAVSVVVSWLALLLVALLVSRAKHKAVLQCLLPKDALNHITSLYDWTKHGSYDRHLVQQGTPAEEMLTVISDILEGRQPPLHRVMAVRRALQATADVYKPLATDLAQRMAEADNMDDEVHRALMAQLLGQRSSALTTSSVTFMPGQMVTRLSTGRLPDHARRMSLSDAMVLDANGHVRMSVAGAPPRVPPAPLDLSTAGSDAEQGGSSHLLATFADVVMLGAASTEPGAFFSKARLSHVAIRPNAAVPQPRLSNPSGVLAGGAACDGPAYAAPAQLDTAEDGPTVGGGAASVAGEADALSLAPGAPPAAAEGSHSPVLFPAPTTAAPSMAGSSLREGYGSSVARSGESACVYMPHDPRPVLVGGTHDGSTPPQRPSLTGSPQQNQELEFGSVEDALVSILRLHDPATLHKLSQRAMHGRIGMYHAEEANGNSSPPGLATAAGPLPGLGNTERIDSYKSACRTSGGTGGTGGTDLADATPTVMAQFSSKSADHACLMASRSSFSEGGASDVASGGGASAHGPLEGRPGSHLPSIAVIIEEDEVASGANVVSVVAAVRAPSTNRATCPAAAVVGAADGPDAGSKGGAERKQAYSMPMARLQQEEEALLHQPEHTPRHANPVRPIFDALEAVLRTTDNFSFDAFALESVTGGRPLSVLGYWLLHTSGLIRWAGLHPVRLARFLRVMEDGYGTAPYHNRTHAADVLQTMHVLLHRGGLVPGYTDQLTVLAAYLAAVVHDYEHLGRNNDYLVNAQHDLALRYNDRSPMENHHIAAAFSIMRRPELNFLEALPKAQWEKLRRLVIDLVLATDMKQHFAIMGQFAALHRLNTDGPGGPRVQSPGGSHTLGGGDRQHSRSASHNPSAKLKFMSEDQATGLVVSTLTPVSDADKLLSLQMALKCADLGHLAAPLPVHLRWVSALEAEFFLQGDAERAAGLPISPLCDRTKQGVTKSQVGFFDFVVIPLYNNYTSRFTPAKPLFKAVMRNYRHWQAEAKKSAELQAAAEQRAVAAAAAAAAAAQHQHGHQHHHHANHNHQLPGSQPGSQPPSRPPSQLLSTLAMPTSSASSKFRKDSGSQPRSGPMIGLFKRESAGPILGLHGSSEPLDCPPAKLQQQQGARDSTDTSHHHNSAHAHSRSSLAFSFFQRSSLAVEKPATMQLMHKSKSGHGQGPTRHTTAFGAALAALSPKSLDIMRASVNSNPEN